MLAVEDIKEITDMDERMTWTTWTNAEYQPTDSPPDVGDGADDK